MTRDLASANVERQTLGHDKRDADYLIREGGTGGHHRESGLTDRCDMRRGQWPEMRGGVKVSE